MSPSTTVHKRGDAYQQLFCLSKNRSPGGLALKPRHDNHVTFSATYFPPEEARRRIDNLELE